MSQYSRREFIGTTALAGAAALMASPAKLLAATHRPIPIGVQLYSLRNTFPKDIPGSLAGVKKLGYDGVEFAGYFSYTTDAKGLRKLLDDNGLKVAGTHLQGGLSLVSNDEVLKQTIEFNQTIGNDKLIVPMLTARSVEAWKAQADTVSAVAEKLKPHNMIIGYHNHPGDFTKMSGVDELPEDIFFGQASKDVKVQLDIGHCQHGGSDPAAYLKKYAGRVISVHVKDYCPNTPEIPNNHNDIVGEGVVKWPEVIAQCDQPDGPQWYIVEEESNMYPGLTGIEKDLVNFKKFLA